MHHVQKNSGRVRNFPKNNISRMPAASNETRLSLVNTLLLFLFLITTAVTAGTGRQLPGNFPRAVRYFVFRPLAAPACDRAPPPLRWTF